VIKGLRTYQDFVEHACRKYRLTPQEVDKKIHNKLQLYGSAHRMIVAYINWTNTVRFTQKEIAEHLDVDPKTIYNDLKNLTEFCPALKCFGVRPGRLKNMTHLGNMDDEIPEEAKSFGTRVTLDKPIGSTYNRITHKTCPKCNQHELKASAKECSCHYEWSCLCENCGRKTNGSPFCRLCIEPGYYRHYPGNRQRQCSKMYTDYLRNPR